MKRFNNFSLISGLIENVIIFNSNLSVIYQGSIIKKLLDENEINIEEFNRTSITKNNELVLLKNNIEKVITTSEPLSFKFIRLKEDFLLIPSSKGQSLEIIFGLKNKIYKITKIEHDLKERVKELQCLYNISKELEAEKTLLEELEDCALQIQQGFQFPQETIVNIEVNKNIYGNSDWNPKDVNDMLACDIKLKNEKRGEIRIYFKHKFGYLNEEQHLIEEISGKISRAIEKDEKEKNLEKQQKILKAKNDILLKLTDDCNSSRQKLRTFFKAITDKIVVVDNDFNIIMSNKDEIGDSGKCFNKLFNLQERCKECPAVNTFKTAQNTYREWEETDKYTALRTYPIFGKEGNVDRVLEVCRDITTQKKMEAQLLQSYKLASLGKLVAGVAHEINNPNTFILGNLKIVQESFTDLFPILDEYNKNHSDLKIARLNYDVFKENISVLVNDMIDGANRTKKIVADLRNFAKKDNGSLIDEIDLNYIIKNNLTLTRKHIKKYAQLDVALNENIPLFKGSIFKLEQVLLNLIMNASEAIEHSEGVIKIATDFDVSNNEIILIVSDNGCGMDENTVKNIFDPFYTTKRNKGGTGLGLSITYGIIKDHGGKIEVESKINEGTKFIIRIPAKASESYV
ncbi:MAG: ATP-binding protein [Ignavibacteriales bacterium]|nr:ATP-binding protein [Ignavibacteriales bacterium]